MANTSKRKRGRGLILAGLLLLAAALALVLYNLWDAWRAERSVAQALEALRQETALSQEEPAQEAPAGEQSPQEDSQEQSMATVEAEGREYLGELRFPTLDLTLPVLSQCSEENLKTAPCRYQGSLSGGDLIVAGHNYQSHFGRLDQLSPGDPVTFTGPDGETYAFEVTETQELPGTALEEMEAGEWDLTLFTCTLDGRGGSLCPARERNKKPWRRGRQSN